MARHANDLELLLNPGAEAAETGADERQERPWGHGDAMEGGVSDASPTSKIALAFILDAPDEALGRESAAPDRLDRQTDDRDAPPSSFDLRWSRALNAIAPHAVAQPAAADISIAIPVPRQQQREDEDGEDEDAHGDEAEPDGEEDSEEKDEAGTTPRQLATTQARAAASRASKTSRVSTSSPTTGGTPTSRKGSKYCIVEGCTSRAKHSRRCWKHGGSVKCKVPDCPNRAKTKGVCWSHGGGTLCSVTQCTTIAVSNGVCWAHGGGKRCVVPHCNRPAYERTSNMCGIHFEARDEGAGVGGAAVDAS